MSERGNFRGRGGGGGGSRGGSDRGGSRGGRVGHPSQGGEKPKKENILDLTKYMDKEISVKFNGGREGVSSFIDSCGGRVSGRVGGRKGGAWKWVWEKGTDREQ